MPNVGIAQEVLSFFSLNDIILAARCDALDLLQYLMITAPALDVEDESGGTALHILSSNGSLAGVKLILTSPIKHSNIELDASDGRGRTSLHLACSNGHSEIAGT